jgi:TatD DNase family protein
MELIDTHAHLTFAELENDIDAVIARSKAAGVTAWITVATDPPQIQKTLALVPRFDNMYAALGVHPHYAKDVTTADLDALKDLAKTDKVVAIGETGLDFHYNFSAQDAQKQIFVAQLQIATELQKPVIIHCRNAFEETLAILDDFLDTLPNVVFHCFSGTADQAELLLERNCHISFTGIVTFKNAGQTRAAATLIGLDRLMIETDCPYICPEPMRNQKINEPALLIHTAKKIAELKNITLEDFTAATAATGKRFFNLP